MQEEFPEQFMVTPKLPKKNIFPWDKYSRKNWVIGESKLISLADAPMMRLMKAIIICDAKILDTHCLEKKLNTSELLYSPRNCSVIIFLSLPIGAEKEFEELSKQVLEKPIQLQTNSTKEISDGFGNIWEPCPECKEKMTTVRPGKVQCDTTGCSNQS